MDAQGNVNVDRFMGGVLEDEGWMQGLSSDAVALVIARLEAALPPGSVVSASRAAELRAALHDIGAVGRAMAAGQTPSGEEAAAIERCLRHAEV